MEINDFIKKFGEELDETPIEQLSRDTVFKDLDEWSSLTALSIIAMIDEEYEVSVTGADMRKSSSIMDLYNIVNSRL